MDARTPNTKHCLQSDERTRLLHFYESEGLMPDSAVSLNKWTRVSEGPCTIFFFLGGEGGGGPVRNLSPNPRT